jgi:hypothetical protein
MRFCSAGGSDDWVSKSKAPEAAPHGARDGIQTLFLGRGPFCAPGRQAIVAPTKGSPCSPTSVHPEPFAFHSAPQKTAGLYSGQSM